MCYWSFAIYRIEKIFLKKFFTEVVISPKKKKNAAKKSKGKLSIDSDSVTEEDVPKKKKKRDELLDAELSSSDSDVLPKIKRYCGIFVKKISGFWYKKISKKNSPACECQLKVNGPPWQSSNYVAI